MVTQAVELRYAARPKVVLKYLGQFSLVVAGLNVAPVFAALVFREFSAALAYAGAAAFFGIVGLGLGRIRATSQLQKNEALVLAAAVFCLTPLVMSAPMLGTGLAPEDAVFEAVSGVTTTGLSMVADVSAVPRSFLFARSWMQWYGGLGFVTFSILLVIQAGFAAKRLSETGEHPEEAEGGTHAYVRRITVVYGILTLAAIGVFCALGGGLFDSIIYAMSSVSTGGFAPHNRSVGEFAGRSAQFAVMLFCVGGAVSLTVYVHVWRRQWHAVFRNPELSALLVLILVFGSALGGVLIAGGGMETKDAAWHAVMTAMSAQTTAGFSTLDPATLDPAAKLLAAFSMMLGGELGSTAGGLKLIRLLIFLKLVHFLIIRTALPRHAVLEPSFAGRRLDTETIQNTLLVMLGFVHVVAGSWLIFVVYGYDPVDSLFEVVSATGTVGLSTGITSPHLPILLKGVLCVDMLMGRLEVIAWLVLVYPGTWLGNRMAST